MTTGDTDAIELRITSEARQVSLVGQCIRALSTPVVGERIAREVELAVCEVANNVVEHAYGMRHGQPIIVEWIRSATMLEIRIHDWGESLPAGQLSAQLPDIDPDDIANLPEGGFGIGLLNALTDRVEYASDAHGRNTLRLFRSIPEAGR